MASNEKRYRIVIRFVRKEFSDKEARQFLDDLDKLLEKYKVKFYNSIFYESDILVETEKEAIQNIMRKSGKIRKVDFKEEREASKKGEKPRKTTNPKKKEKT